MFHYTNPLSEQARRDLDAMSDTAATLTVSGPGGEVTIDLSHWDTYTIGGSPIGDAVHRRIAEAVAEVRAPHPQAAKIASR